MPIVQPKEIKIINGVRFRAGDYYPESGPNNILINETRHAEQSAHLAKFESEYVIKKSKKIQDMKEKGE
jgi:hypothetical protein